jgi:hypothetical protein
MPTKHIARVFKTLSTRPLVLFCLGSVLAAVIGLTAAWAANTPAFADATTHQPERLTELYFSDPSQLPSTIKAGKPLPVSFVVHNLEAEDMNYDYDITVAFGSSIETFEGHKFALANGATQDLTNNIAMPSVTGRVEIGVQLIGQPETIHFWTEMTR